MSLRWLAFALLGVGLALWPVRGFGAETEQVQSDTELLRSVGLRTDGPSLLVYFKKRTTIDGDREQIGKLIGDLGSDDFDSREAASTALTTIGLAAREQLREAAGSADIEVTRRATLCLQQIDRVASAQVLTAAARLLAHHKPEGATECLLAFLPQVEQEISADRERIGKLIRELGSEDFTTREAATRALTALGPSACDQLKEAAKSTDAEVARRAASCLQQIDRAANALVPGGVGPPSNQPRPEIVIDEAINTLKVVGFKDGKPRPALLQALTDKNAVRRAAVGQALCQGGTKEDRQAVWPLLRDPDVRVRADVALALFHAKENAAIPVLIDLLDQVPQEKAWSVEAALEYVAGDKAPLGNLGDAAARKKYREAWTVWWKEHGKGVDLAKLDESQRQLGYTLASILDGTGVTGRVMEVDANGKVRWQIANLRYPIDAQMLPGGERVLIVEYSNRIVTERNLKGEVLWSKTVTGVVSSARRLANGNTFIASRTQLLEVDKDGKQVLAINRTDIAAAMKLRDGTIGLVTIAGNYIRLDAEGKEQKSFTVGTMMTLGGHFEVLPNGHVLVPLYLMNKVVEFDQDGKEVWHANTTRPTSVMRLPKGTTLVGSRYASNITEFDRSGKEVATVKTEGRVMQIGRR